MILIDSQYFIALKFISRAKCGCWNVQQFHFSRGCALSIHSSRFDTALQCAHVQSFVHVARQAPLQMSPEGNLSCSRRRRRRRGDRLFAEAAIAASASTIACHST